MVKYKCSRCLKKFRDNIDYERHVNRKKKCLKINTDYSSTEESSDEEEILHECHYCGKCFSYKHTLKRHINTNCKEKKESDMQQKYDELLQKLDQKLDQIQKANIQNSAVGSHNSNNGNNNNNTINTTNNIVQLLAFGKEDMNNLTDAIIKKILKKGFLSIPALVEKVHFDKNIPQNHNIFIPNMRDKYAMVYDGEWSLKETSEVLDRLYGRNSDFLEERFNEFYDNLDEPTQKKFNRFINQKDKDETINRIKSDLKLLLYNKRNVPMNTKKSLKP